MSLLLGKIQALSQVFWPGVGWSLRVKVKNPGCRFHAPFRASASPASNLPFLTTVTHLLCSEMTRVSHLWKVLAIHLSPAWEDGEVPGHWICLQFGVPLTVRSL